MIASTLLTFVIAGLAMAPGIVAFRGRSATMAEMAATATVSLVIVMLASALLGEALFRTGFGQLPAPAMIFVSLAAIGACLWHSRGRGMIRLIPDPYAPILALIYIALGLASLGLAVENATDGGLFIHSWYNADWFKHLGHVNAVANQGLPARDIFGNGERLHYYWLAYVLPGAGTALAGHTWAALVAANTVVTALFALTFYGLIRLTQCPPWIAFGAVTLGLFITAPPQFFIETLFGIGLDALLSMPTVPKGPALLAIPQYIPQHTLAAAVFMSWALLRSPTSEKSAITYAGALAALASLLAISTLLGAMLLTTYGLVQLWRRRWSAAPELVFVGVAAAAMVLLLEVLNPGSPSSALASPLFGNVDASPWYARATRGIVDLVSFTGPALLAGVYMLSLWKPSDEAERYARELTIALIGAAFLCAIVSRLLAPSRVAIETGIRAVILTGIAVPIVGAWSFQFLRHLSAPRRRLGVALLLTLILIAIPCAYVRMSWLHNRDDRYTTYVSPDDRSILTSLRRSSDPADSVWQYPEPPVLAADHGHDAWAATLAGRTVPNSLRATDFEKAKPFIQLSTRYFAGEEVMIPSTVDWVYLSRALHPASYDELVDRLRSDPEWQQRECLQGACLFSRASAVTR